MLTRAPGSQVIATSLSRAIFQNTGAKVRVRGRGSGHLESWCGQLTQGFSSPKFKGQQWEYHGNIMGISWEYHGNIMG